MTLHVVIKYIISKQKYVYIVICNLIHYYKISMTYIVVLQDPFAENQIRRIQETLSLNSVIRPLPLKSFLW